MKRSRGSWWLVYGVCVALAVGGLAWITAMVLELERSEQTARAEARHQEALRLALWRMDSWFGPLLAREAGRPFFDYRAYYPAELAFAAIQMEFESRELLIPSPLLVTPRSPFVRLHFQVDLGGMWTSPQVPTGDQLELAEQAGRPAEGIAADALVLEELAESTSYEWLRERLRRAEEAQPVFEAPRPPTPADLAVAQTQSDADRNFALNRQEFVQRSVRNVARQGAFLDPSEGVIIPLHALAPSTGPFVPLWMSGETQSATPRLFFVRRGYGGGGHPRVQGFLANWDRIEEELLKQVADLVPGAKLVPLLGEDVLPEADVFQLASIPAVLEAAFVPPRGGPLSTPARATLAVSWLAALLALAAVGFTLRASVAYGEKRSRFASAVTHELRTPLTTFRMYSEMLAKDMVPADKRTDYLNTLQRESERLSGLVENVLAFARLEEGTAPRRRERLAAGDLVSRALPELESRVAGVEGELRLVLENAQATTVETDVNAVKQILFNLVDNACKYGAPADAALELTVHATGSALELRVRDHGAGISPTVARTIFQPFERGELDAADPNPGIGLGLALARGLARDLGGDLTLEHPADGGACFCLRLPL